MHGRAQQQKLEPEEPEKALKSYQVLVSWYRMQTMTILIRVTPRLVT